MTTPGPEADAVAGATAGPTAAERGRPWRLGTRGSTLATRQAELVAAMVEERVGRTVDLVVVRTEGDESSAPLASIGGAGVFTGALRRALLDDRVDLVVHSLKDLPTAPEPGLVVAAVPERADARDVVVARDGLTLGELPPGSRVGTGSPRRASQLHALGLGLHVVDIRGNVDTRIAKVATGEVDAVLLARAGLQRIGRADEATEVLDPLQMLPAPGQGALAVECRADDADLAAALAALEDPPTRTAVDAERAVLATLEAGCSAPVGALGEVVEGDDGDELWLRAVVLSPDGRVSMRRSATGDPGDAAGVGRGLALSMLEEGAAELVDGATAETAEPERPPEPDGAGTRTPAGDPSPPPTTRPAPVAPPVRRQHV